MSQEFLDHLKDHGIIAHRTPPYTPQHNGVSKRRNRTLLDMVRSMMSQTTLPKSFWDYALETATRILNMVPTKKVEKTPYEVWHGKAPKLSYLKVWGCEALVKTRHAPDRMCLYIDAEEHELGDLGEPANYKAALLDLEFEKWLNAMNVEMQSMKDNEVWVLVELPSNGKTIGKVYMEQPEGFVNPKYPNHVCKLKRSIYGLKQASRQWNKRFDDETKKFGFTQNREEPCVYLKASGSNIIFLILYVDDILIMGNSIPMLQSVKTYLGKCFAMKDLGEATYILGIKIYKDRLKRLIGLCQSASTPAEMKRMQNVPYASAIGSIIGDIKRELRVSCYTDAGYLTDADDLKSQTGYVFVLNGGVVDWKSAKQNIFATSSAEAAYIVAFDASKEAVWVRKFISRLSVVPTIEEHISMYYDNT
nr:hypothetical protein [Tanacetum cinerariifolium]